MSLHETRGLIDKAHFGAPLEAQLLLALPFLLALAWYFFAVRQSNRTYKPWPIHRSICFTLGVLCAVITLIGPLPYMAHMNFSFHMIAHLLLGRLAPLLIVFAAPITLLLRTISTSLARHITRFLRNRLVRLSTHPIVAAFLNIGGLWALYTTDLYSLMHGRSLLYVFIHFHLFMAGYLFTVSMIYIDPIPHRYSYLYRSVVLVISLAGHGILAKLIYAHPPAGVPSEEAEIGAMLMYYGGDLIDAWIIFFLYLQWYKATRPRENSIVSQ